MSQDSEPRMSCGARPLVDRREQLEHLRRCADCREHLAADDPTRLFALLALVPQEQAWNESLTLRLGAALDGPQGARSRWSGAGGRGWAVAASLALAALLGLAVLRSGDRLDVGGAAARVKAEETQRVGVAPPQRVATGSMELLSPADADVVRFEVGETTLVMIFDKSLEL